MDDGYIKISRKILEWEWYRNTNTKLLFIHFLLKANWKDGRFEGLEIPRGSFVTSIKRLSEEIGLTESEVRTGVKNLKKCGTITSNGKSKYTVFTIKNYDQYQHEYANEQITSKSQTVNEQLTSKSQTVNEQLTTIEERKKGRKKEVKNKTPLTPLEGVERKRSVYSVDALEDVVDRFTVDPLLKDSLMAFLEMRKASKKPVTAKAMQLCIDRLCRLSLDPNTQIAIVNQSVERAWQGFYELKMDGAKPDGVKTGGYQTATEKTFDAGRRFLERHGGGDDDS